MGDTVVASCSGSFARNEIIDKTGRLIYAGITGYSQHLADYEKWRIGWCTRYRDTATPEGLREGVITRENLEFAIKHGLKFRLKYPNLLGGK